MTQRSVRSVLAGRGLLLLPAAAFAVHELRYRLAYGSRADAALAAQGHGYLDSLAPWLVLLLGLALGAFLARVARSASGRGDSHRRRSLAALWALSTGSLVAVYAAQELLEGVFSAGHPGGLTGLYGNGGWWSLALAVVGGGLVAALLRLASAVVDVAGRLAPPVRGQTAAPLVRPRAPSLASRGVLACAAAGRAPPAV